jgi:hypothetical protein
MQYSARKWGEFHGFNLIDKSDRILPASGGGILQELSGSIVYHNMTVFIQITLFVLQ